MSLDVLADTSTAPLPMRKASMGHTSMGFTSMGIAGQKIVKALTVR